MKQIIILSIIVLAAQGAFSQSTDLTKYVDPFIGTGGHGHTYPGASVPFGMVQLSPDTRLEGWDGCGGYHYSDSVIYGFSHTHLSGTGVPDYCDVLVMPTTGNVQFSNKEYSSHFSHANESASPGYYSVLLDKYNVKAELTATQRVGFHKYTFPKSDNSNFIIDLKHRDEVIESWIEFTGPDEIRGLRRSTGWADDQYVYFVMKFSKKFTGHGIALNDTLLGKVNKADGKNIKAFVSFKTKEGEVIMVKVGISAVSIEGAYKNLNAEVQGWDFIQVRNNAKGDWNRELGKIVAEGGTDDQMKIFYTAMYHAMLCPNLFMDVDGQYRSTDHKVHATTGFTNYTVFSLWDTFRTEHPLLTIIDRKRTNDFINTFLAQYKFGGMLPVWELAGNETFCMIGYHSVPVIVDAYMKGIRGYDANEVFDAMTHDAMKDNFGLDSYKKFGYVAQDMEHESVSKTLEYAYDDWCIAQLAKSLGKETEYKYYIQRAQNYKNVFDASTGFMRARQNGKWFTPFDPVEINSNYTEANAWQYTFFVPQDIEGLAELYGGKDKLEQKLRDLFVTESKTPGLDLPDVTGLIGQYAHGNEPSHHIVYLYDYLNLPWVTQRLAHQVMSEFYKNNPDGLIGNEDCGQMSAWYVLSAMGIYSGCPGKPEYVIGSPIFPKLTINLENGKQFVIKAENVSSSNFYIKSAKLNGSAYNKCVISHDEIMKGGELEFLMDNNGGNWALGELNGPNSQIYDYQIEPAPFIKADSRVFRNSEKVELATIDSWGWIYYTTDGSVPTMDSKKYEGPFEINSSTIIKAFAYNGFRGTSSVIEGTLNKIPNGRTIKINSTYAPRYSAGGPDALIDQIRGKQNWRLGDWQGYQGQDFDAVVDLGSSMQINNLAAGFLQDIRSWIWMPVEVEFSVSDNGTDFNIISVIKNTIPNDTYNSEPVTYDFKANVNVKARYVKVRAKSFGTIPSWHPGSGHDSWVFTDEIIVN